MAQPEVFALACGREAGAVQRAVEQLFSSCPSTRALGPQSRVLVKPNLLAKHRPDAAVTTDPLVLRGVILALQKRGVTQITIADSPGGPYSPSSMEGVYRLCGVAAVCQETGGAAYTACESGVRLHEGRVTQSFTLLRPVLDCDFIVNVPKLKTHVLMGISGAVKNLFGCVPGMQKAEFHMRFSDRARFGHMLVDLCEAVAPQLTIVDGLLAMEGDGPAGGTPRSCGLLLASENPYHLDLAICRYFGMPPERVPTLTAAAERGLCPEALADSLLIASGEARRPIPHFAPPRSYEGPVDFTQRLPGFLKDVGRAATRWAAPKPVILQKKCIGCGKCAEICPAHTISLEGGKAFIYKENCIRCFCCHEMCPIKAIRVKRNPLFRF